MGVVGGAGTRGRGVGCHGFLTIATDKRLQSIKEFPHISWIIEAPERNSNAAHAGYRRDPARVPPPSHFHLPPPPAFSQMREVVFYLLIQPSPQFHSLSLPYSRSLLFFPFLKSEPLCDSIFSSPLLCCAHCHPESKNGAGGC